MKNLKKMVSFLLALVMVLAMGTTVFAASSTHTITIANSATGHTYEAYQIFSGDVETVNGSKVLSNIVWGNGVTEAGQKALGDAAEKAKTITTEEGAAAFAKEVAAYLTNPVASVESTGLYTISGLSDGYYLVKDQDNSLKTEDDFYTAYMMKVVGDNVTAQPKGDKPSLDKQIKHNESDRWDVVGDNQIGDTVEFRTITTIPDTSKYDEYDYTIYDTMSKGLTSNVKATSDVSIKINDSEGNGTVLSTDYYTVTVDASNANKFTIKVDVLKAVKDGVLKAGDSIYSYYTALLNKDALIYDEGKQDNVAYLEYSNNPNDNTGKGKTPEKKVYDWTFKMQVNKVDEAAKDLNGAKFVLSEVGTLKVADMKCNDEGTPTVTDKLIGMVKVSDGVYRIATSEDAASSIVYTVDAGKPVIKGLDDKTKYYLYETKAPAGYNLLADPVEFEIFASYNTDGSEVAKDYPNVVVGKEAASTTLSTNVINKSGSVLPETGGMGTTIFYVIGGILVVCAGIVLITRKRMSKNAK